MLKRIAFLALLAAAACNHKSPTEPIDTLARGLLYGVVTIGPNCPVEQPGNPCPPPLDAFTQRKVLVYDEAKTRLIATVDLDSNGSYRVLLRPGKYTVDMKRLGIDRTDGVPTVVTISASADVRLDIHVDPGIR